MSMQSGCKLLFAIIYISVIIEFVAGMMHRITARCNICQDDYAIQTVNKLFYDTHGAFVFLFFFIV